MGTFHVPAAIKGFNALLSNNLPRIKPCSANWEIYPDAGVIRVASLARKPTAFVNRALIGGRKLVQHACVFVLSAGVCDLAVEIFFELIVVYDILSGI